MTIKENAKRRASKTHHPDDICVHQKLKNKIQSPIHAVKLHHLQSLLENSKCDSHPIHNLLSDVNDIVG